MRMSSHGIDVDVPQGWDGEIYKRSSGAAALSADGEGRTEPVMHLSNFPLPTERGDFGSGAADEMRTDNVFVSLVEYARESAGKALFASSGLPAVRAEDFAPDQMQRPMPGQSGAQYFFNHNGRAFCLYVALGSHARRHELVPEVNQVLSTIALEDL
jgi:hypothetical protein